MFQKNRNCKIFVVSVLLTGFITVSAANAIHSYAIQKYSWNDLYSQTQEEHEQQAKTVYEDDSIQQDLLNAILDIAKNARNRGNLALAVALAEDISQYTGLESKVEPFLKLLEQDRLRYNDLQEQVLLALTEQRLADALLVVEELPNYPPWAETKSLVSLQIDEPLETETVAQSSGFLRWSGPIVLGFILGVVSILTSG